GARHRGHRRRPRFDRFKNLHASLRRANVPPGTTEGMPMGRLLALAAAGVVIGAPALASAQLLRSASDAVRGGGGSSSSSSSGQGDSSGSSSGGGLLGSASDAVLGGGGSSS